MIVLKFGGTSVGSPETIRALLDILKQYHQRGEAFTVVYSAFSKVTDTLLDMAHRAAKGDETYREVLDKVRNRHLEAIDKLLGTSGEAHEKTRDHILANFQALGDVLHGIFLLREASARSLDFVVSFGERSSAWIIAQAMNQAGIPSEFLDARDVIRTDAHFGSAKVDFEETNRRIAEHYAARRGKGRGFALMSARRPRGG